MYLHRNNWTIVFDQTTEHNGLDKWTHKIKDHSRKKKIKHEQKVEMQINLRKSHLCADDLKLPNTSGKTNKLLVNSSGRVPKGKKMHKLFSLCHFKNPVWGNQDRGFSTCKKTFLFHVVVLMAIPKYLKF
jgi:hypothetical protein